MLKITITETPTERRWVLQGHLAGPWVRELRTTWKEGHRSQDQRICIIDLNNVMFIDKGGERLLWALSKKGAQLIASGIYTKYVLEKVKTIGKRSLIMLIVCLFAGIHTNIIVPLPRGQVRPAPLETRVKEDSGLRCNLANPWSRSTESSFNANREGAALCR
jgi:hypothetical protein